METALNILNRITPIIFLLVLGKWIQRKDFLSSDTISELKKLVVNIALPAVLFQSFLFMELHSTYVWFIPIIMGLCVILYFVGVLFQKQMKIHGEYFPFLITGFEYGMMGVSLFGAAYGIEQLGKIAIIDFGQELFVWFIYMALLTHKKEGKTNPFGLIKMFLTSPVIIAIFSGILLNLLGVSNSLSKIPVVDGLLQTVNLIGSLTIPLILIVVGFGIQLDRREFVYSFKAIFLRLAITIPAALLLNHYVIGNLLDLDSGFQAAFFTLLILPPPFILTLFMKQDLTQERHSIDNTLTLHTIITILVFIVYYALTPMI